MRAIYLAAALALLCSIQSMGFDLTGYWQDQPYEVDYYIRQLGDQVWLLAEGVGDDPGPYSWTALGHGTLNRENLTMEYADVPKGNGTMFGTIEMRVLSDDELEIISWTGVPDISNETVVRLIRIS